MKAQEGHIETLETRFLEIVEQGRILQHLFQPLALTGLKFHQYKLFHLLKLQNRIERQLKETHGTFVFVGHSEPPFAGRLFVFIQSPAQKRHFPYEFPVPPFQFHNHKQHTAREQQYGKNAYTEHA